MPGGSTIELSANRTLQLGESEDRIVRVEKGCVELFLVWDSAMMKGRRHHFATLPEGCWIFDVGFGFGDHGVSVLAVGQAETVVDAYALSRDGDCPVPEAHGTCADRLNEWIESAEKGIASLVGRDSKKTRLLSAGTVPAFVAGDVVGVRDETLWWKSEASAMFFGITAIDGECVPLSRHAWVVCPKGGAESKALTSAEFVAGMDWMDEITRAHDLFLRTVQACVAVLGERELRAREIRAGLREAAGDAAWQNLAAVLAGEEEAAAPTVAASSVQSLVSAFDCVARHMGISPHLPADLQRAADSGDMDGLLAMLVRRSSGRMRRVLLEGSWFRRDNGPLIAFLQDANEPVALLPAGRKGYRLRKSDGSQRPVTARNYEQLHPFAYSLYRTFPERKLTVRDVFAFSSWGNRGDALVFLLIVVLSGLLGLVTPALTGHIFDLIIPQAERALMAHVGAALVTAALVRAMLELVAGITLIRIQSRTDANLQGAIWDRLLKLPTQFFRRHTAGEIATRALGITEMHDLLSSSGAVVLLTLPIGLFNFIVMFSYNATLSFWGLGLALLAVVVSALLNSRQVFVLRKQYAVQGRLAGLVFQLINGVAKFRIAGAEHLAFGAWAREYAQQERLAVQAGRWGVASHTFFAGYNLLTSLVIFAVVAVMSEKAAAAGQGAALLTTGAFLAFSAAFGALMASLIAMSESSLQLLRLVPLFERIKPILEAEPEVAGDRASPGALQGEIEIENIRFRYAENLPPVLDNFTLKVAPGEFVALVGPSGAGKSTILRLLLGFETPESGTTFYDGKDLQTLDLREVRRQIGVVLQNTRMIAGDIFRNIVGESNLTLTDAWRAAEMAGLAQDIREMPMQMHTMIGEGGSGFSGGQKQRLAIARAFAHNPRMIVFDEATSALDNRTQAIVTASLEKMRATRIIIAHRLSTIMRADRIVVLRDGRVVEDGTYEFLMSKKGFFHELATRQLAQPDAIE